MNYHEIVARQKAYFNTNETKSISFRIAQLRKFKAVLLQHESMMYEAIYKDFKKSGFDTFAQEIGFVHAELDLAINKVGAWARQQRARTKIILLPAQSYIHVEPLGTCLIIGPWNYPYQLSLVPLVSAIAAGNTIVLKPSEIPAATSAIMAKMINENFPPEYMIVLEGGIPETTALLEQKFDKIFFTGSTAVGKIVYEAAAKHLTPVTLELGGKCPAIVTRNTNLKQTAKRIVWSKFLNAGQTCIAPDYIMVDASVKDEFLTHLKTYIQKFDYSYDNGNYVQIINERNFNRIIGLIDPGKIFIGGDHDLQQRYIAPTILTDVDFDDPVMADEIFGPLLPVLSYTDLDEVIAKIKSRPKPLACYVFTPDAAIKRKIVNELSFGGGTINHLVLHIANTHLPFGGVGHSGMGSYHAYAGFATFSHFKSMMEKPFWGEPNVMYPPYSANKLSWLKRFFKV